MAAPTIESHAHSISTGGTTSTIAVTAAGAGRVIVVVATVGTLSGTTVPTLTISGGGANVGAWTKIGSMPAPATSDEYTIVAWYALTTGAVSAVTVTVTSNLTIDDAALAYVTVAGANTTQPLDLNTTLAHGGNAGSGALYFPGGSTPASVTASTNTADVLLFAVFGVNTGAVTPGSPTTGTTVTESVLNNGGTNYASLGVYTQPFTSVQTGVAIGSTSPYTGPKWSVFGFGITADTQAISGAWTDTAASSDSFSIVSNSFLESLSDSAASSDVWAVGEGVAVSLSDTVASSDSFVYVFFGQSIRDTAASSDSFSILAVFPEILADRATSFDAWNAILTTGPTPECGPIAIFPTLPEGFPVKLSLVLDTTIGTTKSLREMRVAQQQYPLWDIELPFEELVDQTQNQIPYAPFAGLNQFEQLVQLFLMMYGRTNVFAFDAPWDDSRTDQVITSSSAAGQTAFPVFETWGTTGVATLFPVGMIGTITNVKVNGTIVSPTTYYATRSYLNFNSAPPTGAQITMTFSFYYLCRFTEDEQDFEEFSKNRWVVPSLKFRAVYWPGCQ